MDEVVRSSAQVVIPCGNYYVIIHEYAVKIQLVLTSRHEGTKAPRQKMVRAHRAFTIRHFEV